MQIICTKKLFDELQIKPLQPEQTPPLYSWCANLIKINRRKTVVLMCEQNQYVIVLYGLKSKDFKIFDKLLLNAVRNTFLKQHINPKAIECYLSACGSVRYVKNADRSLAARLTHVGRDACCAARHIEDTAAYNDTLGIYASQRIVGDFHGDHFYPDEKMMEDLGRYGVKPLLDYHALELTATLSLNGRDAVRKLIVPTDITFLQLHKVLQKVFEWQNYHLFSFDIYHDTNLHSDPIVTLVHSDEDLEYMDDARLMGGVSIAEYLPEYKYLLYTYDFGDGWEHRIEVTGVLEAYSNPSPLCVSGEGNSPPEDVGGPYGYEDFLAIMANPKHKEYENMKIWSAGQGYRDFDIERINRELRSVLLW